MRPVVEVENLSKLYRLGVIGATTFRDSLERGWYRLRGKKEMSGKIGAKHLMIEPDDPQAGPEPNTLWALEDVSFSVNRGEIVGIIGRNGAGKTTLLKILSRITEPTKGRAIMRGPVSSLLEVGTGFHRDLTGRENIYLNGAILGMRKSEIDRKFDEIVDFSGVEKFIDTPVKRYSSGMYVRLAFAVAAYLEPEILLVDEVLAVGDIAFQKKCLGKMGDISKEGRTVLFVSHNLQAINQLCSRAILIDKGKLIEDAATQKVSNTYIAMVTSANQPNKDLSDLKLRLAASNPHSLFRWTHINIINSQKQSTSEIRFYEPFEVIFRGQTTKMCKDVLVGFCISSKLAGRIFATHQIFNGLPDVLPEGISEFNIQIDPNMLAPGFYEIEIGAVGPGVADYIRVALEFNILDIGITSDKSWHIPHQVGVIDYPCKWSVKTFSKKEIANV